MCAVNVLNEYNILIGFVVHKSYLLLLLLFCTMHINVCTVLCVYLFIVLNHRTRKTIIKSSESVNPMRRKRLLKSDERRKYVRYNFYYLDRF